MNKRKLGTIVTAIGTTVLIVSFILFTFGGFALTSSKGNISLIFIGFAGFFIGGVLMTVGFSLRANSEIANIHNGNSLADVYDTLKHSATIESYNQKKCEYCGSIFDKEDSACPNCGARNMGEK